MKYAKRTALYTMAENPRPETAAMVLCRGCGAYRHPAAVLRPCPKCGCGQIEHVGPRCETASGE